MQGEIRMFLKCYKEVFDDQNRVKLCGRAKCMELIKYADNIEKGIRHGSLGTGQMSVNSMITLYEKLKENYPEE